MSAIDELERYAKTRYRHMGRGELMEGDAGLSRRIVAALTERGVDESELDELVYDAAGADSAYRASTVVSTIGQERVIAAGERKAAAINNSGFAGQVDFLIKAWGAEGLLSEVRGLLRPVMPKP